MESKPENLNNARSFLVLDNLSKTYLEGGMSHIVFEGVSKIFKMGEFSVILGRSGSGKSTLLNLISGIDWPDTGQIFVNGECLSCLDDGKRTMFRRKNFGIIFQFFNLIPTLSVWENLLLPLELNRRLAADDLERASDLLAEVGLSDRGMAYPDSLSGGEQQRVAIARALVHDPAIILADEPTGNLDEENGRIILNLLGKLTRKTGKNLILVTHSLEATELADTVYTLQSNQLIESNP